MFLHLSAILFTTGDWLPSMHHRSHDWGFTSGGGVLSPGEDLHPARGVCIPLPPRAIQDMVNKSAVCILLECTLVTARKRSLGQGNIFAPVCHSVHGGVCLSACWDTTPPPGADTPGPAPPKTRHPPDQAPPNAVHPGRYGQRAGGTHPAGMQSCDISCCTLGKLCCNLYIPPPFSHSTRLKFEVTLTFTITINFRVGAYRNEFFISCYPLCVLEMVAYHNVTVREGSIQLSLQ